MDWIIFIAGMALGGISAMIGCAIAAYQMMDPHH